MHPAERGQFGSWLFAYHLCHMQGFTTSKEESESILRQQFERSRTDSCKGIL